MPHTQVLKPGLHQIFANHRLYQLHHGRQAPEMPSLTDRAAQILGRQPQDTLELAPLHLLPDHLREHVGYYTPSIAFKKTIRDVVDMDMPQWPQAMQQRYADSYVAGLCGYADEVGFELHPDARAAYGWEGEILQPLALGAPPAALVAQVDLGRLLLGATTRELALKKTVWRRVICFANTRHGPLAPPPRPTRTEYEYRYRSHMVLASLTQLWGHLVDEYRQSELSYAQKALPPFTAALCRGAALAAHWDYDLLRLSVTESVDNTTRRAPSRDLRTLRQALTEAMGHPDTTLAASDDLAQLNRYLNIFDISLTGYVAKTDSWRRAGLDHAFASLSDSVKQARRTLSSPQLTRAQTTTTDVYADAHAFIKLWTDSVQLRSPVSVFMEAQEPNSFSTPRRKRFGHDD